MSQQLSITVRYGISDGVRTGSKFTLNLNGSPLKMLRPAPEIINEKLDFGNMYVLVFEKPGHVTKSIAINTAKVPTDVQKGGLNLTLSVSLSTEGKPDDPDTFIKYTYDAASNGFIKERSGPEVTYGQTAEARKSAEELYNLITKQEEKELQYKQHFVKEDALEGRKGEFSQKKEEQDDEVQRAKEEQKAETIRRADEARAARVAQIEEQRKQSMSESERKETENLKKREEQQRKQIAEIQAKEAVRKEEDKKLQEQNRIEAEARRAEEDRRLKDAAAKQAEEARRKQEAAAKADLEKRKREAREKFQQEQGGQTAKPASAAEERPMTIQEAGKIVSRTEEIIKEDKRVIRQITIKRERQTFVYRQVKYDWGGIYYFKNDMDITKNDFELETTLEK
ncbi:MAG: hypothetical protein K9J06_05965 [Flavobacteriales bacterium]|nr:hypothetical protein [Flavobacteriales bacterium]